jgi:hypothetical protein
MGRSHKCYQSDNVQCSITGAPSHNTHIRLEILISVSVRNIILSATFQSTILPPSSRLKQPEDGDDGFLLQHWYLSTNLHGIRSHKTFILLQSYFPKHQKLKQTEQLHFALLHTVYLHTNSGAQPLGNCNGTSHPEVPKKRSSFPIISFPFHGGKHTEATKRNIFHPTILTGLDWAPFISYPPTGLSARPLDFGNHLHGPYSVTP